MIRRNRDGEVLDAAVLLFGSKGYTATTVRDIASAVGVLKGSVYHYTNSKEDLLFRICDGWHEGAAAIAAGAAQADGAAPRRLHDFVQAYVGYCLETIALMRVFTREGHHLGPDRREVFRARRREVESRLEHLVAATAGAGVDHELVLRTVHFICGAINGLPDWYSEAGRLSAVEVAAEYATMATGAVDAIAAEHE